MGNLFLTGARLFTGSFESAIYLLGAITGVSRDVEVIPAINSNFSYHISAGLKDGTVITGQNSISHPSAPSAPAPVPSPSPYPSSMATPTTASSIIGEKEQDEQQRPASPIPLHDRTPSMDLLSHEQVEDANLPGSLPTLRKQYITFAKTHTEDLASPIERIWYINPYGQEIRPFANPKALESIEGASAVIYSIGSLYTSIIPCLILRDVGAKIANPLVKYKILILNGSLDRETRAAGGKEYTARDFIAAIAGACESSKNGKGNENVTGAEVKVGKVNEEEWKKYVTHVIYLAGEGTPIVEREELGKVGVECVRIYGRKNSDGGGGMIYDGAALGQALGAIVGGTRTMDRNRRNTLDTTSV